MSLFLLTADAMNEMISDTAAYIIIGLVAVFLLVSYLVHAFKKPAEAEAVEQTVPAAPAAAPAPAVDLGPMVSSAQVRNGISDEETAVIASAVAASLPGDKAYSIRKIDRAE